MASNLVSVCVLLRVDVVEGGMAEAWRTVGCIEEGTTPSHYRAQWSQGAPSPGRTSGRGPAPLHRLPRHYRVSLGGVGAGQESNRSDGGHNDGGPDPRVLAGVYLAKSPGSQGPFGCRAAHQEFAGTAPCVPSASDAVDERLVLRGGEGESEAVSVGCSLVSYSDQLVLLHVASALGVVDEMRLSDREAPLTVSLLGTWDELEAVGWLYSSLVGRGACSEVQLLLPGDQGRDGGWE